MCVCVNVSTHPVIITHCGQYSQTSCGQQHHHHDVAVRRKLTVLTAILRFVFCTPLFYGSSTYCLLLCTWTVRLLEFPTVRYRVTLLPSFAALLRTLQVNQSCSSLAFSDTIPTSDPPLLKHSTRAVLRIEFLPRFLN